MTTTAVTSKGQVTIPAPIRKALHIKPGDRVRFELKGKDYVLKTAPSRIEDSFGLVKSKRSVTLEEMDEGIKQAVTARYNRSR